MPPRLLYLAAVVGLACSSRTSTPDPEPSQEGARLATAVCGAITRCGCAQEFMSEQACVAAYREAFDAILRRGLEVDEECLDSRVQSFEANGCGKEAPSSCNVFRGDGREDDECSGAAVGHVARGSNCAADLACNPVEGRCAVPSDGPLPTTTGPAKSEGESCDATVILACNRCDLYCASEGVCRVRGALGEPCTLRGSCKIAGGFGCGDLDERLYCEGISTDETGTCAVVPKVGEPCHPLDQASCGDSAEPGYCDPASSTCVAEPAPWICEATLGGP